MGKRELVLPLLTTTFWDAGSARWWLQRGSAVGRAGAPELTQTQTQVGVVSRESWPGSLPAGWGGVSAACHYVAVEIAAYRHYRDAKVPSSLVWHFVSLP